MNTIKSICLTAVAGLIASGAANAQQQTTVHTQTTTTHTEHHESVAPVKVTVQRTTPRRHAPVKRKTTAVKKTQTPNGTSTTTIVEQR